MEAGAKFVHGSVPESTTRSAELGLRPSRSRIDMSWRLTGKQLDESLSRLGTDRIDFVQHHEVIRCDDPHRIFDPEGANASLVEARQAGKIRYIGFTGHKDPYVHLHMLAVAQDNGFKFDAAQMPLNVMDAHYRSFGRLVLPVLVQQGIGVLGMKSMGNGIVLKSKTVNAIERLHYAMNLPTSVVIRTSRRFSRRRPRPPHTANSSCSRHLPCSIRPP
jgi:aryl-alcohol dehydrogenase-like predicted oxidoreductase